jgi:hypothetical protein
MKATLLLLILASATTARVSAQKSVRYYNFEWKECEVAHARFLTTMEHTDSGWHRIDYYLVKTPKLQMDGWYLDSAEKIPVGQFVYAYPDQKLAMKGRYFNGRKKGTWLTYHFNGMIADSTTYAEGDPVGTSLRWYPNGYLADSSIHNPDGSGMEVTWFDNGNPSSAGLFTAGRKMYGKWQFFHKNGNLSAIELYDHGQLMKKQYYDENGQATADTASRDRPATFKGGVDAWLKYLDNHLHFPSYTITNSDQAAVVVSFTVDEDGNVKDPFVSTPFYPPFEKEAVYSINKSPKWLPAIEHNRCVQASCRQPVIFKNAPNGQ